MTRGIKRAAAVLGVLLGTLGLVPASPASAAPPSVTLTPYVQVAPTAVRLRGYVDPNGKETLYYFEYGSVICAGGGSCASAPPTEDAAAGAGTEAGPVTQLLTGLAPGTTYHFRLVAQGPDGPAESAAATFSTPASPSGSGACPNEAVRERQGVAGRLGECRAYELVSRIPAAIRNGADVAPSTSRTRAASDGNALQFTSGNAIDGLSSAPLDVEYMAVRGAAGWSVHGILPRQTYMHLGDLLYGTQSQYLGDMSADLSKGILFSSTELSDEEANVRNVKNLFLRDDLLTAGEGSYRLLTNSDAFQVGGEFGAAREIELAPSLAASSADLDHVLFESRLDLTAAAEGLPAGPRLYEWSAAAGTRLVGILPAAEGGGPTVAQAGRGALNYFFTKRAMSRDGSRIAFTVPLGGEGSDGRLYLRDDRGTPDPGDDGSVAIDASEKTNGSGPGGTDLEGPQAATFWTATPSLSQLFFTSGEALTDDAVEGQPDVQKLYRYRADAAAGHRLTLISVDREAADGVRDEATAAIGVSDDGAYVYFVGPNQLQAGGPTAEVPRIFVWHDGAVHEVAAVNPNEEVERIAGALRWRTDASWARVSPSGRQLAFVSQGGTGELTGYDHGSACPEDYQPGCTEVYLYEASAGDGPGRLQCASCDPTGVAPATDADFVWRSRAQLGPSGMHLNHALSADGRLLFFTSGDRLVPEDRDERPDAYAFDISTGDLSLLSDAGGGEGSSFLDASPTGGDVFFATRRQLVASDRDDVRDVYSARIGGGFDEAPAAAAPCAAVASCRPAGPAATVPPVPASEAAPPHSASRRHHRPKRHRHRAKKQRRGHRHAAHRGSGNG